MTLATALGITGTVTVSAVVDSAETVTVPHPVSRSVTSGSAELSNSRRCRASAVRAGWERDLANYLAISGAFGAAATTFGLAPPASGSVDQPPPGARASVPARQGAATRGG